MLTHTHPHTYTHTYAPSHIHTLTHAQCHTLTCTPSHTHTHILDCSSPSLTSHLSYLNSLIPPRTPSQHTLTFPTHTSHTLTPHTPSHPTHTPHTPSHSQAKLISIPVYPAIVAGLFFAAGLTLFIVFQYDTFKWAKWL